jgi:hypothetical protein
MLSREVSRALTRLGIASDASKPIIAPTIINSTMVNPEGVCERELVFILHAERTASKSQTNDSQPESGPSQQPFGSTV